MEMYAASYRGISVTAAGGTLHGASLWKTGQMHAILAGKELEAPNKNGFKVLGLQRLVLRPPSRAKWSGFRNFHVIQPRAWTLVTKDRRLKRNIQPLYETIASRAKDRARLSKIFQPRSSFHIFNTCCWSFVVQRLTLQQVEALFLFLEDRVLNLIENWGYADSGAPGPKCRAQWWESSMVKISHWRCCLSTCEVVGTCNPFWIPMTSLISQHFVEAQWRWSGEMAAAWGTQESGIPFCRWCFSWPFLLAVFFFHGFRWQFSLLQSFFSFLDVYISMRILWIQCLMHMRHTTYIYIDEFWIW